VFVCIPVHRYVYDMVDNSQFHEKVDLYISARSLPTDGILRSVVPYFFEFVLALTMY